MVPRVLLVLCVAGIALSTGSPKIHKDLQTSLNKSGTANIFVKFQGGNDAAVNSINGLAFMSRGHRITYLVQQLRSLTNLSQRNVKSLLQARSPSVGFKQFWITNEVYVRDADASLVQQLADLPEVTEIFEEIIFKVTDITGEPAPKPGKAEVEWNIERIEADKAWEMPGGNSGDGIVVSTIDTGVRSTHEALRNNFRSRKGWYDPYNFSEQPDDIGGQGTMTMGLIAGGGGIGVAPGSQWIACKGCDVIFCNLAEIRECTQFILCPTDPNGENEDCSMAPNVVANGYGGGVGETQMDDVFKAWTAANIVPFYAVGSVSSPICDSVASYGDSELVIGVGSTTLQDSSARTSALGPNVRGALKPDITAPGENVRSAGPGGDDQYLYITGTTMAGSHVAGATAIILSDDPTLSYQKVKTLLQDSTDRNLTDTQMVCGGIPSTTFPNNQYGHGRLNARRALEATIKGRK